MYRPCPTGDGGAGYARIFARARESAARLADPRTVTNAGLQKRAGALVGEEGLFNAFFPTAAPALPLAPPCVLPCVLQSVKERVGDVVRIRVRRGDPTSDVDVKLHKDCSPADAVH